MINIPIVSTALNAAKLFFTGLKGKATLILGVLVVILTVALFIGYKFHQKNAAIATLTESQTQNVQKITNLTHDLITTKQQLKDAAIANTKYGQLVHDIKEQHKLEIARLRKLKERETTVYVTSERIKRDISTMQDGAVAPVLRDTVTKLMGVPQ